MGDMTMKLLRNRKTGALFPFNENLLKLNRNVEVVTDDELPVHVNSQQTADVQQSVDDVQQSADDVQYAQGDKPLLIGETPIEEATKDELYDFAKAAFGEKLDKRKSETELRRQVTELMRA